MLQLSFYCLGKFPNGLITQKPLSLNFMSGQVQICYATFLQLLLATDATLYSCNFWHSFVILP